MASRNLFLTPTAEEGLLEIETYIEREFGATSLAQFDADMDALFEQIRELPFAGQAVNTPKGLVFVRIFNKRTSVYYEVKEDHIRVLYIVDNRKAKSFLD